MDDEGEAPRTHMLALASTHARTLTLTRTLTRTLTLTLTKVGSFADPE